MSGCDDKATNENDNSYSAAEIISGSADVQIKQKADRDLAIAKAQELYRAALYEGTDFSDGPCLSDDLMDGWVADIAHDPRQAVDDDPANQCEAYLNGTADHFVELNTDGELIRAQ